ncbi:MAG: hypothetical protein KC501_24675, partial [Myxococcales bacterium]|nr:hypothetical protein [Myxococcales bacterium]
MMRPHKLLTVVALALPLLPFAGCGTDDAPVDPTLGGTSNNQTTGLTIPETSSTGGMDTLDTGEDDTVGTEAGTTMAMDGTGTTGEDESSTGEILPACDMMDDPDVNGLDENGDGLDGLAGCSVFVNAAVGSDLNDGLAMDDPVATIARGIEIAGTFSPPRPVLVAEGTYNETVNLDSGVSLYGGYDESTWERDVFLNETVIAGTEFRTLVAINLNEAVEVDGFTIQGLSFNDMGQSTYAVWVRDTPEGLLTIDYCTVIAGDGGDGPDGNDGMAGEDGGNGTQGASNGNGGSAGTSGCGAVGGVGGDGSGCPTLNGGNGSAGGDPTAVGIGGAAGASECSGNTCNDQGGNGVSGNDGSVGVNGVGAPTSMDPDGDFGGDGLWAPPVGTSATRGNHGGGGGGGGAGGYDVDSGILCTFASGEGIGGGGGGGGAGGCGGELGETGGPGGGSFCIVAINSSIDITNTDLFLGNGGNGGDGGDGGNGGGAGTGAGGAQGTDNGGEPGAGAAGGDGGGGGGGGGG